MNNYGFNREIDIQSYAYLKENATWFLCLGISLVVLGTLAIIFSFASTIFSVLYLGFLLMIVGGIEGFQSFRLRKWSAFLFHLALGALFLLGGFFIVLNPMANAISLTLLLAIFFVVTGLVKLFFALTKNLPHKGWVIVSGVLNILLGFLIWQQWPYSGLWVIGMFVGIDAIFTGWTWIMLSMAAKKSIQKPRQ